jgi:DNA-binding transcriptional LysR family regulator
MTLDQLRVFVAVAERGHLTLAAASVGKSQSAVSTAIKSLENSSGCVLFDRVGRNIELSVIGRAFLPEAKALIERADLAQLALENSAATLAGSVAIAASQTIASYWLPRRLAAFHDTHPEVRLDVTIGNTRSVQNAVLDGTADIGLVEGRTRSDLLEAVIVDHDRLLLVTAAGIADVKPDLAGLKWIVRERGSGTREVLEDLMSGQGLVLGDSRISLVLPSNEAVRQAVEAGAGAAIISERVVARALREGSITSLPYDIPERDFVLITHRDRQKAASQLALKDYLSRNPKSGRADVGN